MAFINPLAIKVKHSELEIKVRGQSTGLVLDIRPPSDPVVKALEQQHRKDDFQAKKDGADVVEHALDNMDARLNDRVVAHVAGWRWLDGVDPALAALQYSEPQLREFLAAVPFGDEIRNQVFAHVARDEHFFEMPASSSAQPSDTTSGTACTGGTRSAQMTAKSK